MPNSEISCSPHTDAHTHTHPLCICMYVCMHAYIYIYRYRQHPTHARRKRMCTGYIGGLSSQDQKELWGLSDASNDPVTTPSENGFVYG